MDLPTGPPSGPYDYDLLVIGGGSGGLAVAKVGIFPSMLSVTKYSGEFFCYDSNLFW